MSRVGTIGQIQKVTRVEGPGCLATSNLGNKYCRVGLGTQGDLSSPSAGFRSPDISYLWSCDFGPFPDLSSPRQPCSRTPLEEERGARELPHVTPIQALA